MLQAETGIQEGRLANDRLPTSDNMMAMACSKNDVWKHSLNKFEDFEEEDYEFNGFPTGKRLAPVGANDEEEVEEEAMMESNLVEDDTPPSLRTKNGNATVLKKKIKEMEEDQEELNSSLMALTSHFAKVQFRLQQVVSAPSDKRENLLKELENFAFRGIPNISSPLLANLAEKQEDECDAVGVGVGVDDLPVKQDDERSLTCTNNDIMEAQRKKQTELIYQLKGQLEELESYAYESGEGGVPSTMILERQRVVMEQLKTRLNLRVDNIEKLTADELRAQVDSAVGEIVNPLKMKSHLVNQLQTQIQDLEMFIEFLQGEASTMVSKDCEDCGCNKHNSPTKQKVRKNVPRYLTRSRSERDEIHKQTVSYLEKAMGVLQVTTIAQFGCGGEHFAKNVLKSTTKGNHYGDLRARLEMAVDHVMEACSEVECMTDTDCTSIVLESDGQPEYLMSSPKVASIVRRELAVAIRDLMHHGLITTTRSSLMPLMGCMSARNVANRPDSTHAWTIIVKYYEMKQGREYNAAPARKLSQSFGLDLTGSGSSSKQSFFTAVGQILNSHRPYKRSNDAQLKAFVCLGLNQRKLITWLRLVLRNQTILETFYTPWSYVVKTGFDDAFRAVDRLSSYAFDLQVNVSVKHLQELNEAF